MMLSKTAVLAAVALATFVPAALAGKASVENRCDQDVYLWSVAGSAGADMVTLPPGKSYSETYRLNHNGGGISMKLALTKSQGDITQFEYTLDAATVWYDVSNINGNPFADGGISVKPSDPACSPVVCQAGIAKCREAYNQPTDDHATHACPSTYDLNVVLCPGKTQSQGDAPKKSQKFRITGLLDGNGKRHLHHPHYRYT